MMCNMVLEGLGKFYAVYLRMFHAESTGPFCAPVLVCVNLVSNSVRSAACVHPNIVFIRLKEFVYIMVSFTAFSRFYFTRKLYERYSRRLCVILFKLCKTVASTVHILSRKSTLCFCMLFSADFSAVNRGSLRADTINEPPLLARRHSKKVYGSRMVLFSEFFKRCST